MVLLVQLILLCRVSCPDAFGCCVWWKRVLQAREARVIGGGVDQDAINAQEQEMGRLRAILEAADNKRAKMDGIVR